jgi:hypothetical protein
MNVKTKIHWKVGEKEGFYIDNFGFCHDDEGFLDDYWWTEGNGNCDCNRGSMFLNEEWPCGNKIEILDIVPL